MGLWFLGARSEWIRSSLRVTRIEMKTQEGEGEKEDRPG